MPLRPAAKVDIPAMATILAASFGPDPLFQFKFPCQSQHPEVFAQAFRGNLWLSWYDYKKLLLVSYETSDGGPVQESSEHDSLLSKGSSNVEAKEFITGIAEWERVGKGWEHLYGAWGWWDPRKKVHSQNRKIPCHRNAS